VGKCQKTNKTAAKRKRSVKRTTKHNRSVKKQSPAAPAAGAPHKTTMKWIPHLKMCTSRFNITFKEAMTDTRCKNLYQLGHE
jgi:hypothetical protein